MARPRQTADVWTTLPLADAMLSEKRLFIA